MERPDTLKCVVCSAVATLALCGPEDQVYGQSSRGYGYGYGAEAAAEREGAHFNLSRPDFEGKANRDWGVSFREGDRDQLIVERVRARRPLARAGLRAGDIILSLNGRNIISADSFDRWLERADRSQPLDVVILRDGKRRTLELNWDDDTFDAVDSVPRQPKLGSWADTPTLGVALDLQEPHRAIIRKVYPNSPAQEFGLRAGDTIVVISGHRITSPQQVIDLISGREPGSSVEIEYVRPVRRTTVVRLESREAQGER